MCAARGSYFSLRQGVMDFEPAAVVKLIGELGAVYVKLDGAATGSCYRGRSFCILESFAAVHGGAALMMNAPFNGELGASECGPCCCCCAPYDQSVPTVCSSVCPCLPERLRLGRLLEVKVDVAAAQTRVPRDKAKVDAFIAEGAGAEHVNQVMEREIRRGLVNKSFQLPTFCCCCPCGILGACFDYYCCPQCNPCGWAMP